MQGPVLVRDTLGTKFVESDSKLSAPTTGLALNIIP